VVVKDTGPGLPPQELDRVFERFYQLDKSRPGGQDRGVGLGLAIAKQIIQAHSGEIAAHNQPGQGAVFTVKLPIIQPDDSTITASKEDFSHHAEEK
jgi:signal transduction histidine kinase